MKSLATQKMNGQQGFTLIELVVVIVILGILAVTAAPKFINLQDDARTATIEGVRAAVNSSSALIHSKSLIVGNNNVAATATPAPSVIIDGANTAVNINFGYPTSVAADWEDLLALNSDDFTIATINDGTDDVVVIYRSSDSAPTLSAALNANTVATTAANCFTYYYTPAAINGEPVTGSIGCQVP